MIIGVLVQLSNKNIDKIFDYSVPSELQDMIKIGIRVEVPFGKQVLEGFVLEIKSSSDANCKDILSVKDEDVILNEELLELGKRIQNDTLATLISCYQVMLPKALKAKQGNVINKKFDTFYYLGDVDITSLKLNDSQQRIVDLVLEKGKVLRRELVDISLSSVNTLEKKGILVSEKTEHYRLSYSDEKVEKFP